MNFGCHMLSSPADAELLATPSSCDLFSVDCLYRTIFKLSIKFQISKLTIPIAWLSILEIRK